MSGDEMSVIVLKEGHEISWLNVTHLVANCGNLLFADRRVVIDHVRQRTAFHELHHHPKLEGVFLQKGIQKVDDVVVSALFHHDNLVDNQFLARL